eukprot:scaffold2085_cov263-Pinguiococcus_pyrenoidosus.AAC.12
MAEEEDEWEWPSPTPAAQTAPKALDSRAAVQLSTVETAGGGRGGAAAQLHHGPGGPGVPPGGQSAAGELSEGAFSAAVLLREPGHGALHAAEGVLSHGVPRCDSRTAPPRRGSALPAGARGRPPRARGPHQLLGAGGALGSLGKAREWGQKGSNAQRWDHCRWESPHFWGNSGTFRRYTADLAREMCT